MKNIDALLYYLKKGRGNWEELCNRCGKCCYTRSVYPDGTLFIDYDRPCEYLDTDSNLCTVYERRFEVCKTCRKVNIFHALFARHMPPDCAYVSFYRYGGFYEHVDK
ncbi:hypothetical protein WKV44_05055 [Spirochaetia bacterium 38H-sp]|uniref:YkgJ family cysteine cluster protein n=1 Tax=Rarispira pelagica TaxID=3141764 RepID=A0ABU9UB70_9SPIR